VTGLGRDTPPHANAGEWSPPAGMMKAQSIKHLFPGDDKQVPR
jgi:hypothetical protein